MKEMKWCFPYTNGGEGDGFNDSGIQSFKDDAYTSLAREICQNSLDAVTEGKKAIVEFKSFELDKEEFPGYEEFVDVIEHEVDFSKKNYKNVDTPLKFYSEALNTLKSDKIMCLRISDFNTCGLTGSNKRINSNWSNLVKNKGFNDKPLEAVGAFGIGKNATFACSKLNTVFYSTISNDNLKATQGVARLSTYETEDGNMTQGTGFCGKIIIDNNVTNLMHIENYYSLDSSFHREENEYGTDIFILGFHDNNLQDRISDIGENWAVLITISLIDNFLMSIVENKLEVHINNIILNSETIKDIFNKIYSSKPELFNEYTYEYYNVLLGEDEENITIRDNISMFDPDDVELILTFNQNYHNRVSVNRHTGMKLFDKDRLGNSAFYSGILILRGKRVNAFFKAMENPNHNGWSYKRVGTPEAQKMYNKLFEFVRNKIREFAIENTPDSLDAQGIGEYLADEFEVGKNSSEKEDINNDIVEEIQIKERTPVTINKITIEDDNETEPIQILGKDSLDGELEGTLPTGEKNETDGGNGTKTDGETGKGGVRFDTLGSVKSTKLRSFNTGEQYNLCFSVPTNIDELVIDVLIAGEQSNYKPVIKTANIKGLLFNNNLEIVENKIVVKKVQANSTYNIFFKLEDDANWSLEVNLYENKK